MDATTPAIGDRVTVISGGRFFEGRTGTITWVADNPAEDQFPYGVTLDGEGLAYFTRDEITAATPEPDDDAPTCRECGTWPCGRHATEADIAEYQAAESASRDQTITAHAVAKLTGVIDQLNRLAQGLEALAGQETGISAAQIARFARSAAETADCALMVASNELKLAQRAAAN